MLVRERQRFLVTTLLSCGKGPGRPALAPLLGAEQTGRVVVSRAGSRLTPKEGHAVRRVAGILVTTLVFLSVAPTAVATPIVSTFATGDEGWQVLEFYFTDGNPPYGPEDYTNVWNGPTAPAWSNSGGNPGGRIHFTEPSNWGQCFYFQAPAAFLGNQLAMAGGTLSWDIRADQAGPNDYNADVVLVSGSNILVNYGPGQATTEWQTLSVTLTPGAGWLVGNHQGGTPDQILFGNVLANLTAVYIRGEFVSGPETTYLDNVTLVPEPAAFPLILAGLIALVSRRR